MEDEHITIDMPSEPSHTFLAVFDGHGGSGAAAYARKNMVEFIEESEEWKSYLKSGADDVGLLGEALRVAFLAIDESMRSHQANNATDTSGCTSVTAMITPNYILCANAGDSRCVLLTAGEAKPLSEDHKPYGLSEKKRIEEAGGSVQYDRVDGELAVSRALGDFQWKRRADLPPDRQKVCRLLMTPSSSLILSLGDLLAGYSVSYSSRCRRNFDFSL